MASEYVPGSTVTVAIPLFCAALTAELIAVYCPDPSVATVMAGCATVEVVDNAAETVVG